LKLKKKQQLLQSIKEENNENQKKKLEELTGNYCDRMLIALTSGVMNYLWGDICDEKSSSDSNDLNVITALGKLVDEILPILAISQKKNEFKQNITVVCNKMKQSEEKKRK